MGASRSGRRTPVLWLTGASALTYLRFRVGADDDHPITGDREVHGVAEIGDAGRGRGQAFGFTIRQNRGLDRQTVIAEKFDAYLRPIRADEAMCSGEHGTASVGAFGRTARVGRQQQQGCQRDARPPPFQRPAVTLAATNFRRERGGRTSTARALLAQTRMRALRLWGTISDAVEKAKPALPGSTGVALDGAICRCWTHISSSKMSSPRKPAKNMPVTRGLSGHSWASTSNSSVTR